jgi:asparagine synthase (glutamine-hydrolysing)
MCRIAGIISNKEHYQDLHDNVAAMCTIMAHGGPDDEGISSEQQNGFVFGHRRLALIDLSEAGHQPMYYKEVSVESRTQKVRL